jgi:protein-S-isoprenylcysteine O-methyltransferase Ste14
MKYSLALIIIMSWPVIPIFWIPVHFATGFFRKLGRLTYFFLTLFMAPVLYLVFINRDLIVAHKTAIPFPLDIAGILLVVAGLFMHIWTAKLLTLRGIMGIREIVATDESKLVDKGAFSVVRHPTYLAHSMLFLGAFLFTGVFAVGLLTIVDFLTIRLLIIPLEEKELLVRLGPVYADYMERVPRLIPRISVYK